MWVTFPNYMKLKKKAAEKILNLKMHLAHHIAKDSLQVIKQAVTNDKAQLKSNWFNEKLLTLKGREENINAISGELLTAQSELFAEEAAKKSRNLFYSFALFCPRVIDGLFSEEVVFRKRALR